MESRRLFCRRILDKLAPTVARSFYKKMQTLLSKALLTIRFTPDTLTTSITHKEMFLGFVSQNPAVETLIP